MSSRTFDSSSPFLEGMDRVLVYPLLTSTCSFHALLTGDIQELTLRNAVATEGDQDDQLFAVLSSSQAGRTAADSRETWSQSWSRYDVFGEMKSLRSFTRSTNAVSLRLAGCHQTGIANVQQLDPTISDQVIVAACATLTRRWLTTGLLRRFPYTR